MRIKLIFLAIWVSILPQGAVVACQSSVHSKISNSGSKAKLLPLPKNKARVIHVFTALCDNDYQGIIKVNRWIGNGDDVNNNLYWGCGYGMRTYFYKSTKWKLLKKIPCQADSIILERLIFKHRDSAVYMVVDAYRGRNMHQCLTDFSKSLELQKCDTFSLDSKQNIYFSGSSDLVVFVGHNGLMDSDIPHETTASHHQQAMVFCCLSFDYFYSRILLEGAEPVLLTSSLMCPEAYAIHDAIEQWIQNKSKKEIRMAAVSAYARFQKITLSAAGSVFANIPD